MPIAPRDFTRNVRDVVSDVVADVYTFLGLEVPAPTPSPSPTPTPTPEPTPTPTPTPSGERLKMFFTADIDPANERDDESMMAIAYARQDEIDIRGQVADAPDGLVSGYTPLIDAYEQDRPTLLTYGSSDHFKTADELRAMTLQGARTDTPTRGYWTASEWVSGTGLAAHNAAQAMIAAAGASDISASGTFLDNAYNKLMVVGGGGCVTMAQALYEAVDLGQMPDFPQRVLWLWQSKHNGYHTRNGMKFIFSKMWQAQGVPGAFGAMPIINPCWQAHALALEGTTETNLWNSIIQYGAMGQALEAERAIGNYRNRYFRAMDAWLLWWALLAKARNNFDPTVGDLASDMPAGNLRTSSDGTPYPWNRGVFLPSNGNGGWPTGTNTDTPWHPQHYIPRDEINTRNAAGAYVNVSAWYTYVEQTMTRYAGTGA